MKFKNIVRKIDLVKLFENLVRLSFNRLKKVKFIQTKLSNTVNLRIIIKSDKMKLK